MLTLVPEAIEHYARQHTAAESEVMKTLREATYAETSLPQMLSGPLVGQTLRMLCRLSGGGLAVEVGTFTGYASLWIAGGLNPTGRLVTLDVSEESTAIAQRHWAQDELGSQITLKLGPAADSIKALEGAIDFAFIDADMFLADDRAELAFTYCGVELCAVRDHAPAPVTHAWMINVGLLVVRPSTGRFTQLMRRATNSIF